jgi:hypothetical protein
MKYVSFTISRWKWGGFCPGWILFKDKLHWCLLFCYLIAMQQYSNKENALSKSMEKNPSSAVKCQMPSQIRSHRHTTFLRPILLLTSLLRQGLPSRFLRSRYSYLKCVCNSHLPRRATCLAQSHRYKSDHVTEIQVTLGSGGRRYSQPPRGVP